MLIKRGLIKAKEKSHLIYTLLIVIFIFSTFAFVLINFILIQENREGDFVNLTMGATHDIFAEYASINIDDPEMLNEQIKRISQGNQTISGFEVILFKEDKGVVVSALKEDNIGKEKEKDLLYSTVIVNPERSFTSKSVFEGDKVYTTLRAIKDERGEIVGVVKTEQVLFQAEGVVSKNVQISIILSIVFVLLLTVLFFRYAKIADYPQMYDKAKKSNEMKDEFISMASHEIRTPLTAIRGYAEMLKDYKVNKEQEEFLDSIDVQTKRLDDLVGDLLDISRIEQERMEISMEEFNPKEEIKDVIKFLEYNAKEKNLKLSFEKKKLGKIKADRERLKQILINLIGNSIKYTEEGEVKVVSLIEDGKLALKITDTGIGMSEEEQEKLFQKFYRVKSEKTENIVGTGLGLWITKRLVEMMEGEISVYSEKGQGTEVVVRFPLSS